MPRTLTHPAVSSRWPGFVPAIAVLLGLSFGGSSGARAHDEEPVVDVSRWFGPIDPRLDDAGETVVFSYQGALWRIPRGGGLMTRLTDGAGFDIAPAWSPDGKRIAFITSGSFSAGPLRLIRADDGSNLLLPRKVAARGKLEFDPSGTRILGLFQEAGKEFALAWFSLETGQIDPVPTGLLGFRHFALARDGRSIALVSTQDMAGQQGGNDGPEADVWTIPAQGGTPRKVIRFPARIHHLCWSAHDRSLIVATELGGVHNDLWEVPLDRPLPGARRLTFSAGDEDIPSVSRDGRWLLHTDNRQGPTALVLRNRADNSEQVLQVVRRDFRTPTGQLDLTVVSQADGLVTTARTLIRSLGAGLPTPTPGKFHAPPGALYRLLRDDLHFYVEGLARIELPAGRYQLKAAKGPEYRVARAEFVIKAEETTSLKVELARWTDQAARDWYSGENHIHANYGYGAWYNSPRTMRAQCSGEDLRVGNFMVANSDGDGVFDREFFRGGPDPLSSERLVLYWNQEFRATIWGHMTLLNLQHLVEPIFTGFLRTTHPWDVPTNADIADHTHDQGGFVNYTHPAMTPSDPYHGPYTAKELPVDVALGKVDSIDVMGSNHEANLPLWYRLLNCGFHIPASAGTDCFLNRIVSRLPGSDRVYVHVDGPFTYRGWIDNLKAGRTFVTNGPMFQFLVNDRGAGDTIPLRPGDSVRVRATAASQYPLDRLEVVVNGRVAATVKAEEGGRTIAIDRTIPIAESGWIGVRVNGPPHPDHPGPSLFAHTSPVYLDVPGKPVSARADAQYFLEWIDRLAGAVQERNRIPNRRKPHVQAQLDAARAVYRKLAETK
jgi:TolB protein